MELLDRHAPRAYDAVRRVQRELRPRAGANPINALSRIIGLDDPLSMVEGPAAAAVGPLRRGAQELVTSLDAKHAELFNNIRQRYGSFQRAPLEVQQEFRSVADQLHDAQRNAPRPVPPAPPPPERYPRASEEVAGYRVGENTPNMLSLHGMEGDLLPGVREFSFSEFGDIGRESSFVNVKDTQKTESLAEAIRASKRIDPLIVAIDEEGPYIIEGAHRFDALRKLGVDRFPARVFMESVPNPPTNPFADLPEPKRVFHGTNRAFDEFDPSKLDPDALYGPGYYHTEDATTAGGDGARPNFGYAMTGMDQRQAATGQMDYLRKEIADLEKTIAAGKAPDAAKWDEWLAADKEDLEKLQNAQDNLAPNVRPARLAIKKPFDIDDVVEDDAIETILKTAQKSGIDADWDNAAELLERASMTENVTGETLYRILAQKTGATKADVNKILKDAGYDGITHLGGGLTGNAQHKVWIAFDRPQIRNAFGDWADAAQVGAVGGLVAGSAALQPARD